MPIWPGENDWEESIQAGEGGNGGPDTREVRDILPGAGQSLSCSSKSPGSSTGPRS